MLTDDQKQKLTEQFGACNWQLLDEAYRLGVEATLACFLHVAAERQREEAQ
ncbi:MAG TPA: hypothetical protein VD902_12395 [Symbiobacteriaceae bacterium]|nr:hypothetical protein [Symbiobacteriaceae bacterium]